MDYIWVYFMLLQLKFLAHEPAPLHLRAKFERKLARAELLVKREEAGVRTYPRQLRRLAWKVSMHHRRMCCKCGQSPPCCAARLE